MDVGVFDCYGCQKRFYTDEDSIPFSQAHEHGWDDEGTIYYCDSCNAERYWQEKALNTRMICARCRSPLEPPDRTQSCACVNPPYLAERKCPTCWIWKPEHEFGDFIDCCGACHSHAAKMVELEIDGPDMVIKSRICEPVRLRNGTRIYAEITNIELYQSRLYAELPDSAPLLYDPDEKIWEVVDDFIINNLGKENFHG